MYRNVILFDLLSWLETHFYLHKRPKEPVAEAAAAKSFSLAANEAPAGLEVRASVFCSRALLLSRLHGTKRCAFWIGIWVRTYLLGICGGCTVGRRRPFCHIWLFCFWWDLSSSRGTRSRSTLYSCWGGTVCNVLPGETEDIRRTLEKLVFI